MMQTRNTERSRYTSCTERRRGRRRNAGFTLSEVMVASALSGLVLLIVTSVFIMTGSEMVLCSRLAWSQNEAMRTQWRLVSYLRNASALLQVDPTGQWAQVRFDGGETGFLQYFNENGGIREGQLTLTRTTPDSTSTETLVARGLTEIMDVDGARIPMFTRANARTLRISMRISEPVASGRAADDQEFASSARFAVTFRNAP